MNESGKIHALLSTARIANVPSVVCNVWVGVVLGLAFGATSEAVPWMVAAQLALGGVLLYIGGNFLNDWFDAGWDAERRPERALPRGLFPRGLYAGVALGLMAGGVALAWLVNMRSGWVAAAIVFWIVFYTLIHKRTTWSVIPMGICRALLPVMGSMAIFPYVDHVWPASCALLVYIMGLSLSARHEAMASPPAWVSIMSRALLLMAAILVAWGNRALYVGVWPSVIGLLPYLIWTRVTLRFLNKPVPRLVSALLAGIPLVDWMVLLPISLASVLNGGGWTPLAIACAIIPPLSFLAALALQRLAPAT